MTLDPALCPPNLLLAGAIIYELELCQVGSRLKNESWVCFLVVSLMVALEERGFGTVDFVQILTRAW